MTSALDLAIEAEHDANHWSDTMEHCAHPVCVAMIAGEPLCVSCGFSERNARHHGISLAGHFEAHWFERPQSPPQSEEAKMALGTREPTIETDGGPFADHDQACAVCLTKPAVLVLDGWFFEPCWDCQAEGWALVRRRKNRIAPALRRLIRPAPVVELDKEHQGVSRT